MTGKEKDKQAKAPRVVVIGVGNLLMQDEGIGIHAVQALEKMALPPDVKLVDGGTSPDTWAYTQAGDKLIIIDAAKAGGEPGAIYKFRPEDLQNERPALASAHELGVAEALNLMTIAGNKPGETVIIGVEPEAIDWGMELTPTLQNRLPQIIEVVMQEIKETTSS